MSGFSAEWLALRAPADDAARDTALVETLVAWAADRPLRIADIGGGSGAALRALWPLLPRATWTIYDHDAALLAHAPRRTGVRTVQLDLAHSIDAVFASEPQLVTGFAFFDLVSADWLAGFADRLARSGAALYAPLTYDGAEDWRPAPPFEAKALAAFHADMRRDKGFGPALGPDAPRALAAALRGHGLTVCEAQSPWRLNPGPLLQTLAEGGVSAVGDALPAAERNAWSEGRLAATEAEIGHVDCLVLPG